MRALGFDEALQCLHYQQLNFLGTWECDTHCLLSFYVFRTKAMFLPIKKQFSKLEIKPLKDFFLEVEILLLDRIIIVEP